jgi:hypothetical protein
MPNIIAAFLVMAGVFLMALLPIYNGDISPLMRAVYETDQIPANL